MFTHSVDSDAWFAATFAQELPSDQTVYALNWDPVLSESCTTLEEHARPYAEQLDTLLTKPYAIAGYSFGAHLAFELAQQMHDRENPADLLMLIDDEADLHRRQFASATKNIQSNCKNKMHRYVPRVYPGEMVLFMAEGRRSPALADPYCGWKDLSTNQNIDLINVPGSHREVVSGPKIREWVHHISNKLRTLSKRSKVARQTDGSNFVAESSQQHHLLYLARKSAKEGNLDAEIDHYRSAQKMNDALPYWAYRNLAIAYLYSNETDEALKCFNQAINAETIPMEGYLLLGKYFPGKKIQRAGAESIYNEALAAQPCNVNALEAAARLSFANGDLGNGLKLIQRRIQCDRGRPVSSAMFLLAAVEQGTLSESETSKSCQQLTFDLRKFPMGARHAFIFLAILASAKSRKLIASIGLLPDHRVGKVLYSVLNLLCANSLTRRLLLYISSRSPIEIPE